LLTSGAFPKSACGIIINKKQKGENMKL